MASEAFGKASRAMYHWAKPNGNRPIQWAGGPLWPIISLGLMAPAGPLGLGYTGLRPVFLGPMGQGL